MVKYARVETDPNGLKIVVELFDALPELAPALMNKIKQVPDNVQQDWVLSGGQYVPRPITIDQLYEQGKTIRNEYAGGGITLNGTLIETDEPSRVSLLGVRAYAKDNPNFVVEWKTNGQFITLDAPTLIYIADEVLKHIQKCFEIEKEVRKEIASGALTTEQAVEDRYRELFAV